MAEETLICHKCGLIYDRTTRRRTGSMVFDDHARGKGMCMDCEEEMEEKPWRPQN